MEHLNRHRSIALSTYGIIFLGTPHQGGDGVAWGERLLMVASLFIHTNTRVLDNLKGDSEFLQHQMEQYGPISEKFTTIFAYEIYPTHLPTGSTLLVSTDTLLQFLSTPSPEHFHHTEILMVLWRHVSNES